MPLAVTLDTTQKVLVSAIPVNAAGKEVKANEPCVFSVTAGTVTLDPQPDGVSAFIVSPNAAEAASVLVTDSTGTLSDSFTITVSESPAVALALSASPPVPKAAA